MRHAGWLSMTVVVVVVALALVVAAVPFVLPSEDVPAHKLAAAVIFVASYLALAVGKIPGLSIDRAGVALVGACSTRAPAGRDISRLAETARGRGLTAYWYEVPARAV